MVTKRSQGFTLIETLVAMLLSSLLIILVSTTFLVQNQYYSMQTLHAGAHDNARVATERVAGELRSVMGGGLVVTGARTLTVRSPIVVGMVCDRQGNEVHVHFEGGAAGLDTDEVAGVAARDSTTGAWTYVASTWASIDVGSTTSATSCASEGAVTTGATGEFHTLGPLNPLFADALPKGIALMLYRETTFKIQDSVLDPGRLGFFRRASGGSFVEFATGMDASAQFQYRTGGSTYADTIVAASLDAIDAVRMVADARKPATSGGQEDVTFGWSVTVALPNL
ncbi:MAG TPA: prepilin-type N-terminal cleavage/methylation domain-containing protein [Longimicrobiales bacterium]|nr:prepilin-type N-terminal cleavage/methylation domain-containing protein [Longimicrobiales bacterium]